jgi:hypothetical protein
MFMMRVGEEHEYVLRACSFRPEIRVVDFCICV